MVVMCAVVAQSFPAPTTFSAFVSAYGKHYASLEEYQVRATAFEKNAVLIDRLNNASGSVRFALNAYADLDAAEFSSRVLLPRRPSPAAPLQWSVLSIS